MKLAEAAERIDDNPIRLAGRLLGLGAAEQRAGIPGWAWGTILVGATLFVGVKYGPEIKKRLKL